MGLFRRSYFTVYSKKLELQKHTYGRLLSDTEDTISVLDSINSIKVNTAE